jgi:uncharacterized protein (DUF924 family)
MNGYDIVLRHCGAVGWLGILVDEFGNEVYRTGKHYSTDALALWQVKKHMEDQP